MKVSEAIDQLEVGDTVWVKGTFDLRLIDTEEIRLEFSDACSGLWLNGEQEISLTEPQAEKVEVTEKEAIEIEEHKQAGESVYEYLDSITVSTNLDDDRLAKAYLFGYTVKPKRWVVRHEAGKFFEKFTGNGTSRAWVVWKNQAYIFTDRAKADAVAVLVDGSVEEI